MLIAVDHSAIENRNSGSNLGKFKKSQILVVEDSAADFELLNDTLDQFPDCKDYYDISRCIRLKELLKLTENEEKQPDVVLLDLNLPDASAGDTLGRVQHLLPKIPLIVLSGSRNPDDFQKIVDMGFEDFIPKGMLNGEEIHRRIQFSIARHYRSHALFRKANHDSLTGLANRGLFQDRIIHAMERARRNQQSLGLMLIDVDDFKSINDNHGHDIGDAVLTRASHAMIEGVRESDTVARLGGDEFAILVEDMAHPDDIAQVAKKVLMSMTKGFKINGVFVTCTLSIGIAVFDPESNPQTIEALFKQADTALYRSKHEGKNRFCMFSDSIIGEKTKMHRFEQQVRAAAENNEFEPYFQPVVDPVNDTIQSVETLLRLPSAAKFSSGQTGEIIAILERTNLIQTVSINLFEKAFRQFSIWLSHKPFANVKLAINISPSQLKRAGFARHLARQISASGLTPENIQVEITETIALVSERVVEDNLRYLNGLGIALIIDDFGMGYGNFSYFKKVPVRGIKIDREITAGIIRSATDRAIAKSLVAFAKDAGVSLIAEGVETRMQLDIFVKLGVHSIQGYLTGKPMSATAFSAKYKLPYNQPLQRNNELISLEEVG